MSSAAITSASASSVTRRGDASATCPIGVAASTRTPVGSDGEATSPIMSVQLQFLTVTTGAAAPLERRPMTGLSHDSDGDPVPLAAERARPRSRFEDPFVGWTATLSITLLALFLRLWKLGTPHAFEFDETYYAKDAWSLWHFGYARDYIDNDGGVANKHILNGQTTGLWKPDASMTVHPEVGKWLIGLARSCSASRRWGGAWCRRWSAPC